MRKAHILGKLCVTTMIQGRNAPMIDSCTTYTLEGRRFEGWCIRLQPWRREFGQSAPQLALVLAWEK